MTVYDGTDPFTSNIAAGIKLDSVSAWHGTALPVGAANKVPQHGLFFLMDSISTPLTGLWYVQTSATMSSPNFKKAYSLPSQASASGKFLTSDGTDASWGTPVMELLDYHEASGTEATHTFTPSVALDADTYSKIIINITGAATASLALRLKVNSLATNYHNTFIRQTGATLLGVQDLSQAYAEIMSVTALSSGADFNSMIEISLPTDIGVNGNSIWYKSVSPEIAIHENGCCTQVGTLTDIDDIEILTSTSTWILGTKISMYGIRNI